MPSVEGNVFLSIKLRKIYIVKILCVSLQVYQILSNTLFIMRNYYFCYLILVCFVSFLSSCGKQDVVSNQPQDTKSYFADLSDPHVNKSVKVLLSQAINDIDNVTANSILFKANSPVGKAIVTNDIVVSGVSVKFPSGTLRKVVSQVDNGNNIIINTTAASLNDVFKYGSIHIKENLPADSVKVTKGGRQGYDKPIELSISHTFNKDQNNQVIISGRGAATPTFLFDWQKEPDAVEPNYVKVGLDLDTEYYIGLTIAAEKYEDKALVKGFDFGVKTFIVYGVPIIFRPEIDIYAGITITNPLDVGFSFEGKKNFHVASVYQNGNWGNDVSTTDLTVTFNPPINLRKEGEVKLSFFNPTLEIHPYDIDGLAFYAGVDLGAGVTLSCEKKQWSGDAYLKGQIGVKVEFSTFIGALKIKSDSKFEFDIAKANLGNGSLKCGGAPIGYIDVSTVKNSAKPYYQIAFVPTPEVATIISQKIAYVFINVIKPNAYLKPTKDKEDFIVSSEAIVQNKLPTSTGQILPNGIYYAYIGSLLRSNSTPCFDSGFFPLTSLSFTSEGYAAEDIHVQIPVLSTENRPFTCK